MFGRRLAYAGVGVAAVALMAGNVLSARADGNPLISDVIVFHGAATITADSDLDTPAAVDLVGGSGNYTFTGSGPCLSDPTESSTDCTINSTGNFTNIVCGTGSAAGTATVTGGGETGNVTYGILFVGTIGVLTGTWASTGPDDAGAFDSEPLDGIVLITAPVQVPKVLDTGDCTDAFTVVGITVARELGATGS